MSSLKRKAAQTFESVPVTKKPNRTLESFFSPQVPLPKKSSDDPTEPSHVSLSPEQTRVLRMVIDGGKNVFFTGAAGTGKSLLLRAIIRGLRNKYSKTKDAISITASTGMAASNVGGMTIHSWGAVTPNCSDMNLLIKCIKTCRPALQRWKKTKVLIIDEVSMVDGHLFQQLHDIAVTLRKPTPKPFGGIQIIVTGDFFQLPPVTKNNQEPIFAFESPAWRHTLESTVNLNDVFRQKDSIFISALNALRLGAPSDEAVKLFNSLSRPLPASPILPTELYPLRAQVAQSNASRLNALPSPKVPYVARDSGTKPKLLEHLLAEERLELKTDAQVMLIKNVDDVLVNGVVGKVLGFYHPSELTGGTLPAPSNSGLKSGSANTPSASTSSKMSSSSVPSNKIPFNTKSATETKKNGALLRYVQLSEDGRTPVRVSRWNNKENTSGTKAEVKPEKKQTEKEVDDSQEKYPLVLFEYPLQDGGYGSEAVLIKRDEFRVEDAEGKLLARRVQVPLILAWAMSIHKSQGQTIHRVKVDLGRVFEKGQSYVALSRASSIEGLQVIGFNPKKVIAHHKVIEWNQTLQSVHENI
ncbi:ATP-dependent DNA helicase PIF1 [Lentinula edodes]|uniref:ATP-dependent DNA helicase PIF1 n=1 Tax=Lentinula edodes TaxID=5353 RepID=A0A1Q3EGR3_LENED|nr:ATP-dependent DNA helicase PIF1 [Lentinula edodes]